MTFVGNGFDYSLAPGRTVNGVVKDKATGKPIAGAIILSEKTAGNPVSGRHEFRAVADHEGKYALHGLPLGRGNVLMASAPDRQPYLMQSVPAPVPEGFNPAPLDFELTLGVEVTGRATDAATGDPVPGNVEYFTFPDNPAYKELKGLALGGSYRVDREGKFRLVVPPGPGIIAFRATVDRYPVAVGREQFKEKMDGSFIGTVPHLCHPPNYSVLLGIEPKAGVRSVETNIKLTSGKTAKGRVIGPDDKPLIGALACGLKSSPNVFGPWETAPLKEADFEAICIDPKKPRTLVFIHEAKKLAGSVRVTGEEKGPVEAKLQPWASIAGRLVDADGKPQPDIKLSFVQDIDEQDPSTVGSLPKHEFRTDKNGRFTLIGFVPGIRYNLVAIGGNRVLANIGGRHLQFKSGEEKNVGDVTLKPDE
jgi:hypothetical protein